MTAARAIDIPADQPSLPAVELQVDRAIPEDTLLRLRANGVQLLRSVRVEQVTCDGGQGPAWPVEHRYERADIQKRWNHYVRTLSMAVVRAPADVPAGTRITVRWDYAMSGEASVAGAEDARYAGLVWTLRLLAVDGLNAPEGVDVAAPVHLRFVPGRADRLEAYLKPDDSVLAAEFDAAGNPTASAEPPEQTAWRGDRVEITHRGRKALSHARPVALDGTPIWFGEFHWHSELSGDGQRPLADALASARDQLCLDFAGPTDHMHLTGRYDHGGPDDQAAACRDFDRPGRFCTVPGCELSRRYGHANVYADSFDVLQQIASRFPAELSGVWGDQPNRYDIPSLSRLCVPGRSVIVPHHANMDSHVVEGVVGPDGRPYWCAMAFPSPPDPLVRLYEMVQSRGAFETETPDETWRTLHGGFGGSAQTALMRGYRVGFVAGTDNHCGWPTRLADGYAGVTAVLAGQLDTASIFRALHDRRCYATTGARIVADWRLNDQPMGSELRQQPGDARRFTVKVRGTAPLTHVQIIQLGCVLHEFPLPAESLDLDAEWADQRPGRPLEQVWYYLRIRQVDGHCAWLSPFWIDLE